MKPIFYLAVLLLMLSLPAWAQEGAEITGIKQVTLQPGVNNIPSMTADGRDGQIIKAWRASGNAEGYTLFLTIVEGKVIGIATDNGFADMGRDHPHTREDAMVSARFAWGNVGGNRAFLYITATRMMKPGSAPADPAITSFDIYKLVSNGPAGTTGDFFERIKEFSSSKKYCNADLALFKDLGMPLPQPFEGPNQDDGCL